MGWFKRCTVLVLGVIMIVATGITAYASETSITVRVTYDATLVSNNSVGDDWVNSYTVSYNGESYEVLPSGTEIEIEPGDTITMTADIEEYDDSMSDTASESWDLTFDEAGLGAYGEGTMTITVRENGGRYSGNTATWEVYWYAEVVAVPEEEDEEIQQGHHPQLYDSSGREIKDEAETTTITETVAETESLPKVPGTTVFVYGASSTYHVTSYCPDRENGDVKVYAYDSALEERFKPCNTCVDKTADSYQGTEIPKDSKPTLKIDLELIVIIAVAVLFAIYFVCSMRKTRAQAREIQLLRKIVKAQEEELEERPGDSK